jgi:hypothetical protein
MTCISATHHVLQNPGPHSAWGVTLRYPARCCDQGRAVRSCQTAASAPLIACVMVELALVPLEKTAAAGARMVPNHATVSA